MPYAKDLREKLGRISLQMVDITDKCEKEGSRGLTSAERETWDSLTVEYSRLEDSIKVAEQSRGIVDRLAREPRSAISEVDLEELRDTFQLSPAQKRHRERDRSPHARAFYSYLRNGMEGLQSEDRAVMTAKYVPHFSQGNTPVVVNTMSTTTGSQGGYVVPQGFSGLLEEAKKWFGGIEGVVGKFESETGNPWPWPTVNDTTNRGRIIGQNQQVVETDLVFGQTTFNAFIGSSDLILIPLALLQDSYFDIDGMVSRLLGIRMGRLYNWKCTLGTGTNEPTGIVLAAVASGNILTLSAGSTASVAYNNLIDLEHSVDPAYRENDTSRFMFSDTMLKLLKKLVDSNNRPLWQPGLTASFQHGAAVMTGSKPKILEHEYVINNDMAIPSASAYSGLFGDMDTFKVRQVTGGTTVLRLVERYADYMQIGFIAFQRFDSNLVDAGTHPIAVLQQSSS